MNRKNFLKNSLLAGTALSTGTVFTNQKKDHLNKSDLLQKHDFKLKYSPHFGMFENHAGRDLLDQLQFMSDVGFRGFEDNGLMRRSPETQERIGKELARLDMQMGVFVIDKGGNGANSFTAGNSEYTNIFVEACKEAVEVAKRVNATWMTVVPGNFTRHLPLDIQTSHVIDTLRLGAEIFEPHGLVMVLEPLSDTPDLFLRTSVQTHMICRAVDSPACKFSMMYIICKKMKATLLQILTIVGMKLPISSWGIIQAVKNPEPERSTTKISSNTFTTKVLTASWAWSMENQWMAKRVNLP